MKAFSLAFTDPDWLPLPRQGRNQVLFPPLADKRTGLEEEGLVPCGFPYLIIRRRTRQNPLSRTSKQQ